MSSPLCQDSSKYNRTGGFHRLNAEKCWTLGDSLEYLWWPECLCVCQQWCCKSCESAPCCWGGRWRRWSRRSSPCGRCCLLQPAESPKALWGQMGHIMMILLIFFINATDRCYNSLKPGFPLQKVSACGAWWWPWCRWSPRQWWLHFCSCLLWQTPGERAPTAAPAGTERGTGCITWHKECVPVTRGTPLQVSGDTKRWRTDIKRHQVRQRLS